MAIDYNTDILPLFTTSVVTDEPYASVPAALQDNEPERRILTTIEVIRSHMAVLSNRTEANLLQQVLSILMEKVGSGGFVYTPEQLTVVGNICNPTFAAGASVDITIGGTTISPASASGGDIDTVIGELNTTIGAAATAEETDVTTIADTPAGFLSGKHFFLSDPTDDYYVWMSPNAAIAEVIDVTVDAASLIIGGERFHISSPSTDYYVWYDKRRAEVSAFTTAADIEGSLGGTSFLVNGIDTAPDGVPKDFYVWYDFASVAQTDDITVPAGAGLTPGPAAGDFFTFDSVVYGPSYVWYSDGTNVNPVPGGFTDVTPGGTGVAFTGADTAIVVATSTVTALSTFDAVEFASPALVDNAGGTSATVTITRSAAGFAPNVPVGPAVGAFVFATSVEGSVPATDPLSATNAITVTLISNDSATVVAEKTATAVGTAPEFGASDAGTVVTITNAFGGAVTDISDVDTGFTEFTATTQGLGANTDDPAPAGRTEIKVTIDSAATAGSVAEATSAAVGGVADFGATDAGAVVTVTNATTGTVLSPFDGSTSEFSAAIVAPGSAAGGTDPGPFAGRSTVTVSYFPGDSASEIATDVAGAVGALGDFSAVPTGSLVEITNTETGVAPDGSAETSGFTVEVSVSGTGVGSIEAFKTSAGKIGFRNTTAANISFTLAEGTGGILGPAGISAGDTLARPEVVSAAQIDDAIGAYVAAPRDTALI